MYRIDFDKHKLFILYFKKILKNNFNFFFKKNSIKGFFFYIRVKISVTGNARKKKISFNVGNFSKTNKNLKFDYQFDFVATDTGSLGMTMYLCY